MFSDHLTDNLLRICDAERISYETAADRCDISPRYFGRLIRKKSSPTLIIFERICSGFHATPNDLLGFPMSDQLRYRIPKPVTQARYLHLPKHLAVYPICPECNSLVHQQFPNFCCNCGQALSWDKFDNATFTELL